MRKKGGEYGKKCGGGSGWCPEPPIHYSRAEGLSRGNFVKQERKFTMLKSRSCATVNCEPCQSLTAAALSGPNGVPQGNFDGVGICGDYLTGCFKTKCTSL